jgi:hypothetical protein
MLVNLGKIGAHVASRDDAGERAFRRVGDFVNDGGVRQLVAFDVPVALRVPIHPSFDQFLFGAAATTIPVFWTGHSLYACGRGLQVAAVLRAADPGWL